MSEHKEPIPSMIYNAAVGGHVTNSQQIIDENENKEQSQINTEVKQILGQGGSVDERIANSINIEKTRAETAEQLLQEQYNALTQSDIVVGTLPESGTKNLIYRVPGTSSYSDYMWDGTKFVKMAEYDNAIDDEPTAGSENLVKSGGVIAYNGFDLFKLNYSQGSITSGGEWLSNTKCIFCPTYFNIDGCKNIVINNNKQENGKYWKTRIVYYTASKAGITETDFLYNYLYTYAIPSNAVYFRVALSLIDIDDTDIDCTPSDIPNDGTKIFAYFDTSSPYNIINILKQSCIYDVSKENNGVSYTNLSDALNAIPKIFRNSGITIQFTTPSQEYLQYRLKKNVWSNNISDWESIDDRILPQNENPISSNAIANEFTFDLLSLTYSQGSVTITSVFPENTKCIYCSQYIPMKARKTIYIFNNKQLDDKYWKIRIVFYDSNKVGLSQIGFVFVDGLNIFEVPDNTSFFRISLSLIDADNTDIDCTPNDIPIDGTHIWYITDVSSLGELIAKINKVYEINGIWNLFNLYYRQGSIYTSNMPDENNLSCIYTPNYIPIYENRLIVNNKKQQDGKYWKVRVVFYDNAYNYLSQYGYTFVEGNDSINIPVTAKYMRFCLSLTNADGTDAQCTPNDIPTDGTEITFSTLSEKLAQNFIKEIKKSSVANEVSCKSTPLPINKMLGLSFTYRFNVLDHCSGCACYNEILFVFVDGNDYVNIYNVNDGTLLQHYVMPNPNTKYHNNSVSFGSEKYDSNDEFPLLYASEENYEENKCIVYRISGTPGNYTLTVVQEIVFPSNSASGLSYHNCYIDNKNNYMIISGLVNGAWSGLNNNTIQYLIFQLPSLSNGNVSLDMRDVLYKSIKFAKMPTTQGGFCKNGYLYQVYGVASPQILRIFDIKNCSFCYEINLTEELRDEEPESIFAYNDKLFVELVHGDIYELKL